MNFDHYVETTISPQQHFKYQLYSLGKNLHTMSRGALIKKIWTYNLNIWLSNF